MSRQAWLSGVLSVAVVVLLALLFVVRQSPSAQGQVSEGQADKVIALASTHAGGSVLYVIDTSREVVLVYGFHNPGPGKTADVRTGAFEFLAGRSYRWDLLLASKREYALRGVRTLSGLRPAGPGSSEEEYKRAGE
ncbi:MAG TPA: hypothetical protein VNE39_20265 [Planctomycetota bacterium]|nr:hypothetical protein [Planctomycetota bacterium]